MSQATQPTARAREIRERPLIQNIARIGHQAYASNLKLVRMRCQPHRAATCGCMDPGCTQLADLTLPGSGILLKTNWRDSVHSTAALLIRNGVMCVTSHAGCGAVKLFCEEDPKMRAELDAMPREQQQQRVDQIAEAFARAVVAEMRRRGFREATFSEHISLDKLNRPPDYHDTSTIYYAATDFSVKAVKGILPNGFHINRRDIPAYKAQRALEIALRIIFGANGIGEQLSASMPLAIFIVHTDYPHPRTLGPEVRQVISRLPVDIRRKICIAELPIS